MWTGSGHGGGLLFWFNFLCYCLVYLFIVVRCSSLLYVFWVLRKSHTTYSSNTVCENALPIWSEKHHTQFLMKFCSWGPNACGACQRRHGQPQQGGWAGVSRVARVAWPSGRRLGWPARLQQGGQGGQDGWLGGLQRGGTARAARVPGTSGWPGRLGWMVRVATAGWPG
jgi:hypothetical protein